MIPYSTWLYPMSETSSAWMASLDQNGTPFQHGPQGESMCRGSVDAEVYLAHHGVLEEIGSSVVQHGTTGLQDIAAPGHLEGHQGILFDQQDRGALTVDLLNRL